ncbi:unnamed protein product [Calypogeia fissa]
MKPKKLCQRYSIWAFTTIPMARCGFLCCAFMICIALAVFHGGRVGKGKPGSSVENDFNILSSVASAPASRPETLILGENGLKGHALAVFHGGSSVENDLNILSSVASAPASPPENLILGENSPQGNTLTVFHGSSLVENELNILSSVTRAPASPPENLILGENGPQGDASTVFHGGSSVENELKILSSVTRAPASPPENFILGEKGPGGDALAVFHEGSSVENELNILSSVTRAPASRPENLILGEDGPGGDTLTVFHGGSSVENDLDILPSVASAPASRPEILILGENGAQQDAFLCDRSKTDSDVCLVRGNVHVVTGNSRSVVLHSRVCQDLTSSGRNETIRPYTCKTQQETTMASVEPVTLNCVVKDNKNKTSDTNNLCDAIHSVPAVMFSSAGHAGNVFHDFQDVLIPLFIVSQHLKSEVVLIINDLKPAWVERWSRILNHMSRFPIIDLKEDSGQHCFPEVIAGLYVHGHLNVVPSLMPNGETIDDFRRFLYEALASPTLKQRKACDGFSDTLQPHEKGSPIQLQTRLPKLLIIERTNTRILINLQEVVELAQELQFDVTVVTPSKDVDLQTIYGWFHSADVVLGVHGAGLANMLFMRRKAVLVQIIPVGTAWPSQHYFGTPASHELGLTYMEYKIKPEESTLSDEYGVLHPILQNPRLYLDKGWDTEYRLYLRGQNVRPSPTGLREVLVAARSAAVLAFPSCS